MAKSRSCSLYIGNATALYFLLILLPLSAMIVFAVAGAWTFPVFVLSQGGMWGDIKYRIAAQGYSVDGQLQTERGWRWDVPDSWPRRIHQIPLVLLFHLVLAAIILAYFLLLVLSMYLKKRRHWKRGAITDPERWVLIPAIVLALGILGLAAANVILVFMTGDDGFKPDILGYFVIILGLLIPPLWLWAILSGRNLETSYRFKDRHGRERTVYEDKHGRSLSRRGDNIFNRMIKG